MNNNPKDVFKIATELDQFNKERQFLEKEVLDKILKKIDNTSLDPVIVLSGKDWHEGVLGIVASRIKDKFKIRIFIIFFFILYILIQFSSY